MKRILFVWTLCLLASFGSFGALLMADRSLGLPLPYSMPLSFAAMLVAGGLLQIVAASVWPRRPIVVAAPRPQPTAAASTSSRTSRHAPPNVVVLFDMATVEAAKAHAHAA
jgi:hypothetical protein